MKFRSFMISAVAIVSAARVIPVMAEDNFDGATPVTFDSHGEKVAGKFFSASGDGPFPVAILIHGFPGGEGDVFGLGQRLSEHGFDALAFNYRGTFKSEGIYLPSTSLEDVESAINYLKSPSIAKRFSVDTTNIILIGYSYGGGMALLGSLFDPSVKRVVSIAGADLNILAGQFEQDEEYRLAHQKFLDECMADSSMCRSIGGKKTHEWLFAHRGDFDIIGRAGQLSAKKILLIGGWRDESAAVEYYILPLFRALRSTSIDNVDIQMYDADHSFEDYRESLADDIINWLTTG